MFFNISGCLLKRYLNFSFALLFIFVITGCGNKEPQQRSSFIIFLQTEIINKNRINLPILASAQQKQFGVYTKDYQMLVNFHNNLKIIFSDSPVVLLQKIQAMNNIEDLLANQRSIESALSALDTINIRINSVVNEVRENKLKSPYPVDLKPIFDNAYNKIVIQQTDLIKHSLSALTELFNNSLGLIYFLQTQGDNVMLSDNKIEFSEQVMLDQYNRLNEQLQKAKSTVLVQAARG